MQMDTCKNYIQIFIKYVLVLFSMSKNKIRITLTVDDNNFQEIKKICEKSGQKVSSVVNILIHNFINDKKEDDL
jgi:hypothetical protein